MNATIAGCVLEAPMFSISESTDNKKSETSETKEDDEASNLLETEPELKEKEVMLEEDNEKDESPHIGKKISFLRKSLYLTQGTLAEMLDISRTTICSIEKTGELTLEQKVKLKYLVEYLLSFKEMEYLPELILRDIDALLKQQLEEWNEHIKGKYYSR